MLSRVADHLYWLNRYLERTEHTARVLDLTLNMLLEQRSEKVTNERMNRLLESLYAQSLNEGATLYDFTHALACNQSNPASIISSLAQARENARQIREQISSEMWEHLNTLYHQIRRTNIEDVWQAQTTHTFFRNIKEGVQLFQGLTDSTMSHNECWQFLQVGRYMERANCIARLLDVQFRALQQSTYYPVIAKDYLDWVGLLKCCTAFEAYCKVYTADLRPERIAEFLLLNIEFPHSIHFSVDMIDHALKAIDSATATTRAARLNRMIGKLKAQLRFSQIDEVMESGLSNYLQEIQKQCGKIHDAIYEVFITYPVEKALAS